MMPPAYVVTEIDIADTEAFREYAPQVQPSFAPYGGRYLVRGGTTHSFAGEAPKRLVVLAHDNMERVPPISDIWEDIADGREKPEAVMPSTPNHDRIHVVCERKSPGGSTVTGPATCLVC